MAVTQTLHKLSAADIKFGNTRLRGQNRRIYTLPDGSSRKIHASLERDSRVPTPSPPEKPPPRAAPEAVEAAVREHRRVVAAEAADAGQAVAAAAAETKEATPRRLE